MPAEEFQLDCAWSGGFNVAPRQKGAFGYLLAWSGLGGVVLAKDIVVWNPVQGGGTTLSGDLITCVGVVEQLTFGGDTSDPIRLSCFVSKDNQTNLRAKLTREIPTIRLKTNFAIVDYDPSSKSWYDAVELRNPTELDAALNTKDGELQIDVEASPTRIAPTLDVEVYRFVFEMVPTERTEAEIQFATGPTQRIVREWAAV